MATWLARFAAGDLFAHERDQLPAELRGILQRFEAADEEAGDAGVVVAQQRLGDLLRGADQGGGIAAGAGGRGDRHPEPVVEDLALRGEIEQALRAGRGRGAGRLPAMGDDPLQVAVRLVPRFGFRGAEDGSHGDAEGRGAPGRRGRPHGIHPRRGVRERLAPEHVDVGVLGADRHRGPGGAAEVDRDRGALQRLHVGEGVFHLVELALVIERLGAGPHGPHDVEELVGAPVAVVLRGPVAVARQLAVAAAGDDVERDPAAAEMIERHRGAGGDRRRLEPRPVRHQHVQALRVRGGMGGDEPGIGTGGVVADEDPVEPRRFVGAGEIAHEVRIDRGLDRQGDGAVDLRDVVGPDHADELARGSADVSSLVYR